MILTFKYRIKDATTGKHLARHAVACNQVWNYCNQIQKEAEGRRRAGRPCRWPSAFDFIKLCTGCSSDLGLHSDTVQTICREYAAKRDKNRGHLRFRSSFGAKRALGWVPFVSRAVKVENGRCIYLKRKFYFWNSRDIEGVIKAGCFVQDARGRWYVCFQCKVSVDRQAGNGKIGIDLGLKTLATCSDGVSVPAMRHYRKYEAALATAQRAGNKNRVRAIHAKIANARRHYIHEQTTEIVRNNQFIAVGNVSSSKLAKTKMAKSVLDAGWRMLKTQLAYKARRHNAVFVEVDERYTSQTCSCCGTIPGSSPKGLSALGIRHWICSNCGCSHDRDVNAARNILRVGLERQALAGEIPAL